MLLDLEKRNYQANFCSCKKFSMGVVKLRNKVTLHLKHVKLTFIAKNVSVKSILRFWNHAFNEVKNSKQKKQ